MIRETAGESALELAARRLERATAMLEARLAERGKGAPPSAGELFEQTRPDLAAELAAAKARQRELEEAGAEASAALGRAILEIRAALNTASAEH